MALGFLQHEFHERLARWVRELSSKGTPELAACPITELGIVRVLAQASQYGFTIAHARSLLLRLKTEGSTRFTFVSDDHDASRLPGWVKRPKQTTDGHLAQLARANGAILATLDRRIPGAFLIPHSEEGSKGSR